jgi:hypothetical protein
VTMSGIGYLLPLMLVVIAGDPAAWATKDL